MKSCLEFGECLKLIVSSLNITYNQLARGINVDPSLVSKWINNKRVPPYNSNHIQNIAKFISSTVSSSQQERNINEVMKMIS
ncbi:MAG: XRE family transcriptional regulator, partial [Gottschalkiaceae bacterium]